MQTLIIPLLTALLSQLPLAETDSGNGGHAAHLHADAIPMAASPALAGRIEGRVSTESRAPRRQARQYRGAAVARAPQSLPTIVYLKGAVGGVAAGINTMPSMAQQDTAFAPGFVAVALGGEVTFPNRDPFFHNVFSYSPAARFDLGRYPQGETKEVTFDTPGVVKVFCEVHESMRSLILVTENPFHAEVREDGSFVLEGVPAGTWTLVAWDADRGETEQEVRVTDGGTARVELEIG